MCWAGATDVGASTAAAAAFVWYDTIHTQITNTRMNEFLEMKIMIRVGFDLNVPFNTIIGKHFRHITIRKRLAHTHTYIHALKSRIN